MLLGNIEFPAPPYIRNSFIIRITPVYCNYSWKKIVFYQIMAILNAIIKTQQRYNKGRSQWKK